MRAKRDLTRERVVAAAAELLDRQLGQPITLAQVAEKLGIRTSSLYNHVAGLEDLNQAIALYGARELTNQIGNAAIARSGSDALIAIAQAYREFAKERPGLYQATQRAPTQDNHDLSEAAGQILHILERVLEPYSLSPEERVHAVRALRSMVHGFTNLELNGGFGMPVDVDRSFEYLVGMLVDHLATERAFKPHG